MCLLEFSSCIYCDPIIVRDYDEEWLPWNARAIIVKQTDISINQLEIEIYSYKFRI